MAARAQATASLLSYGSHEAPNPFAEPVARTKTAAGYESGMDDSPMYEDVPFNREQNVLELQDVGLTSLYVADCRALSEMARLLGRAAEADELEARAAAFGAALDTLWVEERGYYLNYRTDLGRPSERRSPTLFYPLLAGVASEARAGRLIREHLLNPERVLGRVRAPVHHARRPLLPPPALLEGRHLAAAQFPHLPRDSGAPATGKRQPSFRRVLSICFSGSGGGRVT